MARFNWQAIDAEIPAKGKGYLILKETEREKLFPALREGAEALLSSGATEIYVTGQAIAPMDEEGLHLSEVHQMLWMERSLEDAPASTGRIVLRPMEQGEGGKFLALYNECFFDVPNSATYTRNDLERMEREHCQMGFALSDGVIVGIYELRPDQDMPEICSLGLAKVRRGVGLGRELLLALMEKLKKQEERRCKLMVSSANIPARCLYERVGFRQSKVISHWYRLHTEAL